MTDPITSESIIEALRRARVTSADPAGESELDQLVRSARFDEAALQSVRSSLQPVIGSLQPSSEWWALHVLLGQLHIKDARLGEAIDSRIANGGIVDAVAQLWAARSVVSLGATLSAIALERLALEGKVADPVLWFGIMMDTQERATVEDALVQVAVLQGLNERQLSDLVRTFKRWAVRNELPWNGALSRFFGCLTAEVAVELANTLFEVIGPSFVAKARERLAIDRRALNSMEERLESWPSEMIRATIQSLHFPPPRFAPLAV